ncbi:hypothetical protein ACOW8K_004464 [Vibrio parahaemolyticus]|nr:hypothetical protein [Vibrio parahaemolyticus]EJG1834126.1 hypothetical protein [Vibrio parahaemolyticus]HAS6952796.1 hypothetical protein [Vibrio parahaemolyticus]
MPINRYAVHEIEYEESFVAFLDVLGFKQMIQAQNSTQINKYFGIVNSAIEYLNEIPSKREIGSIVISDSVILTVPCNGDSEEKINKLRQLCIAVGLIQQNLAVEGIWLRGAISCGDTYFSSSDNQIVGPAYINAYLLEEQLAVNPRVILDSKLIPKLGYSNASKLIDDINKSDQGGLGYSNWGSRILFEWTDPRGGLVTEINQDLPLFIDYLSPLIEARSHNSINKVLKHIQKNMYSDSRIYSKYRWVADYLKALSKRAYMNDYELTDEQQYKLDTL